jgi:ubiquinone/menaquinone biosynthesis C-methylase UbiE
MENESEYHDAMITLLELIWGEGFMAPGGAGNIEKIVDGLDVRDKRVLDVGCGIGGPAFILAGAHGANVVGTDLEPHLIEIAKERAKKHELGEKIYFRVVEPGPLTFPDESFDFVVSSGAFTQIADKLGMFKEVLRVLKPGGVFSCYDWMKSEGEYSDDMLHWFKVEGLTYAMETPERHEEILRQAGFVDATTTDASKWYREHVLGEYEKIRGELYPRMLELIGKEQSEHFVENWRAMVVVCEKREMRQVYTRSRKP